VSVPASAAQILKSSLRTRFAANLVQRENQFVSVRLRAGGRVLSDIVKRKSIRVLLGEISQPWRLSLLHLSFVTSAACDDFRRLMDRAARNLRASIVKGLPQGRSDRDMRCRLLDRTPSERFRSKLVFL